MEPIDLSTARSNKQRRCPCPNCQAAEGLQVVGFDGKRLHSCHHPRCGLFFDTPSKLTEHITKRHNRGRCYPCTVPGCSSKFARAENLRSHSLVHAPEKRFSCQVCSAKFYLRDQLTRHLRIEHKMKSQTNRQFDCRCSNCLQTSEADRIRGSNGRPLHVCPHENCRRLFEYPSHLADHLGKHNGRRPYPCEWPHCDRQFLTKDHMRRHMMIHTGEKNYECPQCGYKTYRKDQLQAHVRKHQAPKRFSSFNFTNASVQGKEYLYYYRYKQQQQQQQLKDSFEVQRKQQQQGQQSWRPWL